MKTDRGTALAPDLKMGLKPYNFVEDMKAIYIYSYRFPRNLIGFSVFHYLTQC